MPAFGGPGFGGVTGFGQSGNVTTVPPAAVPSPPPPPPPPAPAAPAPTLPPVGNLGDYGGSPIGESAPSEGTFGFGSITAGGVDQWLKSLAGKAGQVVGELGGIALGQAISENPRVAILTGELGRQFGKSLADEFYDSFHDTTGNLINPAPQSGTTPTGGPTIPFQGYAITPTTPPPLAPLIDSQCAACGGDLETLTEQRGELAKEIETEQQQSFQQKSQQRAQQLQRFQQLEKQPADQRNIDDELQQKQQILNDLDQQIQQLQQQMRNPPGQQPGNYPPPAEPGTSPLINRPPPVQVVPVQPQPSAQPGGQPEQQPLFQQRPQPGTMPNPEHAVTFCVGCASQNDALLFLNGEPSQCSVLPGSNPQLEEQIPYG
jgi:hypothetical protein